MREEMRIGEVLYDARHDGRATASGKVYVQKNNIGCRRSRINSMALSTSSASPTTSTASPKLGAHSRTNQRVIVNEENSRLTRGCHAITKRRGISNSISVPLPISLRIATVPPWRAIRSTIDWEIP